MHACAGQFEALVKLLLHHGADVNFRMRREQRRLETPAFRGDYNMRRDQGALEVAALHGDYSIVKLLLAHGANIFGSAVECAIKADNPTLVRFLLDSGAPVRCAMGKECLTEHSICVGSPLLRSIEHKQRDMTRFLIERGADLNTRDRVTPLAAAISQDDEETVMLLLQHGADPNVMTTKFGGSLSAAVKHENEETCYKYIRLLLDAGAHINLAGIRYHSPLMVSTDLFIPVHAR
jgi:ankyrin repeat protein